MLFSSIPSPSSGVIHLGPIALHAYGLCIALGVLAAVWLATRRWRALNGTADDITAIAVWGVPAGIIGSRIYHVATDFELYTHDPLRAFAIWDGGLGIWGGIAGGVLAGAVVARRRGLDVVRLLDVAAPALPLAQAIGRWGNYFNQELYGKATNLPWALHIDAEHRPPAMSDVALYHPTFLYESLWNLALCGALIVIGSRLNIRKGNLFALYVAGYTLARFFVEGLRVDYAHVIAGLRLNQWASIVMFVVAVAVFIIRQRRSDLPATEVGPDE